MQKTIRLDKNISFHNALFHHRAPLFSIIVFYPNMCYAKKAALHANTQGNIVQRYKALKDLEKENKIYRLELDFDIVAINLT